GRRAEEKRGASESLDREAQALELRLDALESPDSRRSQLERLGEQDLLRGERPPVQLTAQPLEEHALVRDVLVDEEDLVRRVRHDEGVLDLADDAPEEGLAPVARLTLAEERGLARIRASSPAWRRKDRGPAFRAAPDEGRGQPGRRGVELPE